jgi:hypothetical protein
MKRRTFVAFLASCGAWWAASLGARGELVDDASIPYDAALIDFSQFRAHGRVPLPAGGPPIAIDQLPGEAVLLRTTQYHGLLLGDHSPPAFPDNNYYLGSNGHWGPDRDGFVGVGGGDGTRGVMRFEFADGPVSFVGGVLNYSPDAMWLPVFISALDERRAVLERHAIDVEAPIDTNALMDAGEFRGISRPQNDIFAFEISAPFAVVDDLRFFRIPEPHTGALAVVGGMTMRRRRRRI